MEGLGYSLQKPIPIRVVRGVGTEEGICEEGDGLIQRWWYRRNRAGCKLLAFIDSGGADIGGGRDELSVFPPSANL